MRLLPTEKKAAVEAAIKEFNETGYFQICEPCDCGSHVRHNNGGNYHEIITLKKDRGECFAKYETTSELEPPAEWKQIQEAEAIGIISKYGDWL